MRPFRAVAMLTYGDKLAIGDVVAEVFGCTRLAFEEGYLVALVVPADAIFRIEQIGEEK